MLQATRRNVAAETLSERVRRRLPVFDVLRHVLVNALMVVGAIGIVVGGNGMVKHLKKYTAIQSVQVMGDFRRINHEDIRGRIDHLVDGDYFTTNLVAVRAAVLRSPWVENAVVSRNWPNIVRVQLTERQPVARWGEKGLISARGELFTPPELGSTSGLPMLFGPADKAQLVMEQYRVMNTILHDLNLHIAELQLTDRMSWNLRLDNGMSVVVDSVDTIAKLQRFAFLYQRQLAADAANIASVDLRYRNGVAVGWKFGKSQKNATTGV